MEPAVTRPHQFVIRHVEQITQLRLLQLRDKTSGRIPDRGRRHAVPQRNATHLASCDGVPVTRSLEDSNIKRSTVWRFRD
jgi:predicted nicotinamide N-methyase